MFDNCLKNETHKFRQLLGYYRFIPFLIKYLKCNKLHMLILNTLESNASVKYNLSVS